MGTTLKTEAEKTGKPNLAQELDAGKQLDLKEIAEFNANAFLQKMELAGEKLTKMREWPQYKAMFKAGYGSGLDFGFALAKKLAALPTKKEINDTN